MHLNLFQKSIKEQTAHKVQRIGENGEDGYPLSWAISIHWRFERIFRMECNNKQVFKISFLFNDYVKLFFSHCRSAGGPLSTESDRFKATRAAEFT